MTCHPISSCGRSVEVSSLQKESCGAGVVRTQSSFLSQPKRLIMHKYSSDASRSANTFVCFYKHGGRGGFNTKYVFSDPLVKQI